jgi:hypothetical protein
MDPDNSDDINSVDSKKLSYDNNKYMKFYTNTEDIELKESINNYIEDNKISDRYDDELLNNKNNLDIFKSHVDEENNQMKNENYNTQNQEYKKLISNLLYQLKTMSDRQIYLLDVISNLQKNSSEHISNLNKRIEDLELKLSKENNNKSEDLESEDNTRNYKTEGEDSPNNILSKLLNENNSEELINYLNKLKLEQIKKIDIKLIEDILIKFCILLTEGFKVHEIIIFVKGILIINKIKLKEITKKNLKDVFNYVQNNLSDLKDEDSIDISLILSFLNI